MPILAILKLTALQGRRRSSVIENCTCHCQNYKCCDPITFIWYGFVLTQAVKHLVYMEIAVRKDVQLTAETMSVTYRKELVLNVLQDGWTQLVTQV